MNTEFIVAEQTITLQPVEPGDEGFLLQCMQAPARTKCRL